jgi:hypothetical protein
MFHTHAMLYYGRVSVINCLCSQEQLLLCGITKPFICHYINFIFICIHHCSCEQGGEKKENDFKAPIARDGIMRVHQKRVWNKVENEMKEKKVFPHNEKKNNARSCFFHVHTNVT